MVKQKRVPPEVYNKEYLLSEHLEVYQEYSEGSLSAIKVKQVKMLELDQQTTLLEIGFGRGEFLRHCAEEDAKVWGIDYSEDAFEVAKNTLGEFPNSDIRVADCKDLPFPSGSFERVYSGDVIEHLCIEDQATALQEMYRVLKPGGFLLIHTSPNTIFTHGTYPIARNLLKLIDSKTIRGVDEHLKVGKEVHVYEHNLFSLKRVARRAGLVKPQVWIDRDILRSGTYIHTQQIGNNFLVNLVGSFGRHPFARFFLGNDLYLKCYKPNGANGHLN